MASPDSPSAPGVPSAAAVLHAERITQSASSFSVAISLAVNSPSSALVPIAGGVNTSAGSATPCSDVAVQPDFYYERKGLPGVCVFVDGPAHDDPRRVERDGAQRTALEDRGYRVISITHTRPLEQQFDEFADVFQVV